LELYRDKWTKEQLELKKQLIMEDDFPWQWKESKEGKEELKYIGGVDISFVKENEEDACASLVVLSYPAFEVVYKCFEMVKLDLPYIPTFLAFREAPHLVKLIEGLRKSKPELMPQLLMVDGNGFLHPRGFGLACHLGVLCGIPTIGIGKTFLVVDGITLNKVKELEKTLKKGGESVHLVGDSSTVWGALLRPTDKGTKAIFVSLGHRIGLETAIKIARQCCLYKIPEPVRQADLLSRDFIRQNIES